MGGVIVVILLVAWLAWTIFVQVQARQQLHLSTPLGKIAVQEVIDRTFGSSWARVAGPGHVNVRQKLRRNSPTISIDVEPGVSAGCEIDIWMSSATTRYGMAGHAQLVWRKKRTLAQALSVASLTVGATPGPSASVTRSTDAPGTPGPGRGASHSLGDDGSGQAVLRLLNESSANFVMKSSRSPQEVIQALRTALPTTQAGSATHFMVGPPRATMWGHVEALQSGVTLVALSLVTRENADLAVLREALQAPLELRVAPGLGATMEVLNGGIVPAALRDEILSGRVVPLSELGI